MKRAVRATMGERDLFPADLANAAGVSEREMQRRLEPNDGGKHLGIADLLMQDRGLAGDALQRILAPLGLAVVELPSAEPIAADAIEHHEVTTSAVQVHLLALEDKVITRAEGAELEAKLLRSIQVEVALLLMARRAQQEGVVGTSEPH